MAAHPVLRNLHDLGLATWAGGSLMGAVGLNGAAAALDDPRQRARASTAGWTRWAPVNAAAIGAHLVGASGLLVTDWSRVRNQQGVATSSALKTLATGAGLGVAAWSAALNRKMAAAGPVPVAGATEAGRGTPPDVAKTLRQLKLVQWLNPAVGFTIVALTSWQSEQQRPTEVAKGTVQRVLSAASPLGAGAAAGTAAVALGLLSRRRKAAARTAPQNDVVDLVQVDVVEVDVVDLDTPVGTPPPTSTNTPVDGSPVRPVV